MLSPVLSPAEEIGGRDFSASCDWEDTMSDPSHHDLSQAESVLLDATAVAELLGVPASWVYAEARAGRLPHVRVGRYRRFRRCTVETWIEQHERGPIR